jgi:4-amino-4-deoxy-L-arabinose transferase-like glycosyltransferase
MRWSCVVLVLLMLLDIWYRAHTFGPDVRAAIGISLWPSTVGASEPLDCDEAAYGYIGHRVLQGDVLYRDLTENKPPLGYWLYTIAVGLGGYRELAIRIMAIPFVLLTMAVVWWIALRLGGPVSACLAAGLYVLLSTDPFLFGNGSNLEHFINLFAVLSLALLIHGRDRADRRWIFGSGVCLGAAALVKQVAIVHALVYIPALVLLEWTPRGEDSPSRLRGLLDGLVLALGMFSIVAVAAAIILAQGAGPAAYDDIVLYGRGLATDTLAEPNAPSAAVRWLTGNADPRGQLPWPFGSTDYLAWWGTGSWPLWLAAVPALADLILGVGATPPRCLVAAWTLAAWVQVVLPGLYWQHYYLLPIPGMAIAVAVALGDATRALGQALRPRVSSSRRRVFLPACAVVALAVALGGTCLIQVRDYLCVAPEQLTIRYKGGRQWVVLREMGRDLARRATIWDRPHLYIWGWQSPLFFYSGLDCPTRHFFVDNLLRDQADRGHPLIEPRTREIVARLRTQPPELVFTGYPPFGALREFLSGGYLRSYRWPGLWIRRGDSARFEGAAGATAPSGHRPERSATSWPGWASTRS